MSEYPIIHEKLYTAPIPRQEKYNAYVNYPMSLLLDDDGLHIYLIGGFQDKYALVGKWKVSEILASLTTVKECPYW